MTTAPTTRKVKRFRVKIGESYATLDFNLHEKGALVRCHSVIGSHVFNRHVDASYAIKRTTELQKAIREGMFPNWDRLAAVSYTEAPTVEEFQREERAETD